MRAGPSARAHRQLDPQLLPALADKRLLVGLPLLYLSAGKLPEQPPSGAGRTLLHQEAIAADRAGDQRRNDPNASVS